MNRNALTEFAGAATSTVGHLTTEGFLHWEIQPVFRPVRVLGLAFTVSCGPADNSALVQAIEEASPGDVLVIHRHGDRRRAPLGGILALAAQQRGLQGAVIDGAVTDWREITELGFPVFARNLSALTTRRSNPEGDIGSPVSCGGVVVRAGDVILGDEDGVVCIPPQKAEELLRQALRKQQKEERMKAALYNGKTLAEAQQL